MDAQDDAEPDPVAATNPNPQELLEDPEFQALLQSVQENTAAVEAVDFAEVASTLGLPAEELLRREAIAEPVRQLVAKFSAEYPDLFGGFYFEHLPSFRAVFRLAGGPSAEALVQEMLESDPATLEALSVINFETAPFPLRILEQVQADLTAELRSVGLPVSSWTDPKSSTVHLDVESNSGAAVEVVLAGLPGWKSLPPELQERIQLGQAASAPGAGAWGGSRLPIGDPYCTSAFVVRESNAPNRIGSLSAGHCPNGSPIASWMRPVGGADYQIALTYVSEALTGNRDLQYYDFSSQDAAFYWFTYDLESQSQVAKQRVRGVGGTRSYADQQIGDSVCSFGYRDYRDCGTIIAKNWCPSWVPNCTASFMLTSYDSGDAGSSGGPVYVGNTALGVIAGRASSTSLPPGSHLVYTAINRVSQLGVTVQTCTVGGLFCPAA